MHLQQKQRSFLTFGFTANGSPTSTASPSNGNSNNSQQQLQLAQSHSPLPKRDINSSSQSAFNNQVNNVSLSNISSVSGGSTNNSQLNNQLNSQLNNQNNNQNPSNGNSTATPPMNSDAPEIRKYKKRFNSEILCASLWGVNLLIGTENGLMLLDRSGQGKVYQLISRRRFQQMEVLESQNILVTISGKKSRVRVYYLSWLFSKIIRTEEQIEKRNGWMDVGDLQDAVHFKIGKIY